MHKKFLWTFAIAVVCLGALGPIGIPSANCMRGDESEMTASARPELRSARVTPAGNENLSGVEQMVDGRQRIWCGKIVQLRFRNMAPCCCCVGNVRTECGETHMNQFGVRGLPYLCPECKTEVDKHKRPGDPPLYVSWYCMPSETIVE